MKILIVTLSYFDDSVYSKFFQIQNLTWNSLDVDGIDTFFLLGNSESNNIEGNLVRTNVPESLMNCGRKQLECFKLIKDLDFDYVFRTNSSSYVDKNLLKNYLSEKPRKNFYSGVVGNHNGIKFSSGSGYIISKDLIELILENEKLWNHNLIDDVSVGDLLSKFHIHPAPAPRHDVLDSNTTNIPLDFYHYRIKSFNRDSDCEVMKKIHILKNDKNSNSN